MHNRHTAAVRAYHIREGPSSSFCTMLGTSTSTRYAGTCMLYASMLCAQIFPPLQYLHQQYIRSTEYGVQGLQTTVSYFIIRSIRPNALQAEGPNLSATGSRIITISRCLSLFNNISRFFLSYWYCTSYSSGVWDGISSSFALISAMPAR